MLQFILILFSLVVFMAIIGLFGLAFNMIYISFKNKDDDRYVFLMSGMLLLCFGLGASYASYNAFLTLWGSL